MACSWRNYLPPKTIIDKSCAFCHMAGAVFVPRCVTLMVWQIVCGATHITPRQLDKTPHWRGNRSLGPWMRNMQDHTCPPALRPLSLLSLSFATKNVKRQMNLMLRKGPGVRFPHKLLSISGILGGLTLDSLSGVAEVTLFVTWNLNRNVWLMPEGCDIDGWQDNRSSLNGYLWFRPGYLVKSDIFQQRILAAVTFLRAWLLAPNIYDTWR